jgi:homoserine dehydrogenase
MTGEIGIGLLGLGNVGTGVVKLLEANGAELAARVGARLVLRGVALRDAGKARPVAVAPALVTTRAADVVADPRVQLIVELIGGETTARELVAQALHAGKPVVTANKALLAVHGGELLPQAARAGTSIYFEAAVCGGLPIIRALRDGLASDRVEQIRGIVNGTSNYILTSMADRGATFAAILAEAQAAGYAEAEPSLDVDGIDAAHKLALLCLVGLGARVRIEDMLIDSLRPLEPIDFEMARRFGFVIKPMVIGRLHGEGSGRELEVRVHPALVPQNWLLAAVNGVNNAVYVTSTALGNSLYYGRGAGMMPTAVAVVSDLIEAARDLLVRQAGASPAPLLAAVAGTSPPIKIRDRGLLMCRSYLRLGVRDEAGVLAGVTSILARHAISIAQLVQSEPAGGKVDVVMLTHAAREKSVQAARAELDRAGFTVSPSRHLRIAD